MEAKIVGMNTFFEEQIAACQRRKQELFADGREDEATFETIRANIYDVFRTVFSVAVKTCGEDGEKVQNFFTARIQQIPSNWVAAQEMAKAHQEDEKVYLEQIKLDAVADIRENFVKIWGNEP